MPLHIILGKHRWEDDLRDQCQRFTNVLVQPPQGDDAEKLMAEAEAILRGEKFVRCDDRSEKLWHNDLVTFQKDQHSPCSKDLGSVTG